MDKDKLEQYKNDMLYDAPEVKNAKSKEAQVPDDYVAPPFDGGADYEEVSVEGSSAPEVVLFVDENEEVTVAPEIAELELERYKKDFKETYPNRELKIES